MANKIKSCLFGNISVFVRYIFFNFIKSMKKLVFLLSILFTLFSLTTMMSCEENLCKNINCNNGVCIDGDCVCDTGYSGTKCAIFYACHSVKCGNNGTCVDGKCDCDDGYCSIELRAAYFGAYDATEICALNVKNYTAEVKTSGDGSQYMIITNLYNHFADTSPGMYQPVDTHEIPEQFWTATGLSGFKVSGTGSVFSANEFSINFILEDTINNTIEECSVIYKFQ